MSVLASEWTKFRSLRGNWIVVAATALSSAALGALSVSDVLGGSPADLPAGWDPTAVSLKGFVFAQLLIGMLGALGVAAEHRTGTIGPSLAIVPARSRLLAAKAAVLSLVALATAAATTLLSFGAVQLMLGGAGLPAAGLDDPGVPAALAGGTLYLTLTALIGLAVGALTRSATTSLAVLVGVLLLVPALGPGLPGAAGDWFARYWPSTAGQAAYTVVPVDGAVAPWLGLVILAATAAGASAASHLALRLRDA
jgi:ABC-type transport system involved in multi-copper enzyme maturation permease subunit